MRPRFNHSADHVDVFSRREVPQVPDCGPSYDRRLTMAPRTNGGLSKSERHRRIVAALGAHTTVRISSLAAEFGVSAETVRRDIDELTRRGLVARTYGGAAVTHVGVQPGVEDRDRIAVTERARIGAAAAALVSAGDVIMVDSGSTTSHFARALAARAPQVTVLTNSYTVATILSAVESVRVIMCPGDFYATERGVYGPETTAFLSRFHADLAFIGASALSVEGPSDVETRASWVKRTMVERAERTLLLIDSGKFGKHHLEVVCPLRSLSGIVTDQPPPGELGQAINRAKIQLIVAPTTLK